MKTNLIRVSLLFVLLAAVPQMPSAATFAGVGQNANSSTTMAPEPKPNPCRHKCLIVYRRCMRVAGTDAAKRKACAISYRACLRRCIR